MDWLKLFALLVALTSSSVLADGPKKKIRIHIPQKVKHIHHHKKIYITTHPAHSQYAPAYLPSADSAVAVPSNVALPAVAGVLPLNSVEYYDGSHNRLPAVSPAASKLLPLYRARGYYGPNPTTPEYDEQEYDLAPPPEPVDQQYPSAFSGPGGTAATSSYEVRPKRVKVVKLNEAPRKKVPRKKPKRVVLKGRPHQEEEHPVSSFHEQFYSDLEGSGTIRKIKKPPRIEKIIDGDTEHIHTYSEEHIHKVVFDDPPKVPGVLGVDPVGSMSALTSSHPLIPIKNAQTLLALQTHPFDGYASAGSMGTPSHLEYAAYNPRDVTHDHIFHDHGEIPPGIEITRDALSLPPKVTYNSQGFPISEGTKWYKSKYSKYSKPTKPTDFSYYESIYAPKLKRVKPTYPVSQFSSSIDTIDNFRPVPALRFKDKVNKVRNVPITSYYVNRPVPTFQLEQQGSAPAPFSLSSTVVHDYKPRPYGGAVSGVTGFSNLRDPFANFKDSSYANDYDIHAASSNMYQADNKNDDAKGNKKKSISSQSLTFGGKDLQTVVDHLEDQSHSGSSNDAVPTALDQIDSFDDAKSSDSGIPTQYTIRETSPAHQYYSDMAKKALQNDPLSVPEASNDNYQYAEAPTASTTPYTSHIATTPSSSPYLFVQAGESVSTSEPQYDTRQSRRHKNKNKGSDTRQNLSLFKELESFVKSFESHDSSAPATGSRRRPTSFDQDSENLHKNNLKYGDRI